MIDVLQPCSDDNVVPPSSGNPLTDYNAYMEVIQLALSVEANSVSKMLELQGIDLSIQRATGTMGMLLEQFNTALQKARQDKKDHIEVTDLMREGIDEFKTGLWQELEERHQGVLNNYLSPFPTNENDQENFDTLKLEEVELILTRLSYLTNLDAYQLKNNSFKYQELIHMISQMTSSMTEFFIINKQNWTKNQRTT